MITLYLNQKCPFCTKTLEVAEQVGAPLIIKDIHEPGIVDELIAIGGKKQMPFMRDDETGISMYESTEIMAYLHQKFDGKK